MSNDPVLKSEINHDIAQSTYAASEEYRAQQLELTCERAKFITSILNNVDVIRGYKTYSLVDIFSGIDLSNALWMNAVKIRCDEVELSYFLTAAEVYDSEPNDLAKLYIAGKLPEWQPTIMKCAERLADMVIGEVDE